MEANSIGGDRPPGQGPKEKKWSDEQMALIHAAMMEELGICRKDTLPLDDKGVDMHVRKPVKKQVVDDLNDPTARWRNIQFDDVDPAEAELDSMYDGQLYRLRKKAMSNTNQQEAPTRGGRSPGHGRGGGATRGGHSGRAGRAGRAGRGGSGRDGHNPRYMGRQSEIPNVSPHRTGQNQFNHKAYFNDARQGMNNHARIDALVADLRAKVAQTEAEYQATKIKEADAAIAEQRQQASANASSSRRPQEPTAMARFALASQDTSLVYAGFNKPAPAKSSPPITVTQTPSRPLSPSVTSKSDYEVPVGPIKVRLPQPPQFAVNPSLQSQQNVQHNSTEEKSTVIHDILAKENQPHTVRNGDVGLAGSRWAAASPIGKATSTAAAPPSSVLQTNTLAKVGRTVLREYQVKVTKLHDGVPVTRGIARLLKNHLEDRYFTIEVEIEGKVVLKTEVHDGDLLTCESTVLTYRNKRVKDGGKPMPVVTWSITFQLPHQAWTFYNQIASNLHARDSHKQPEDNAAPQSGADTAASTPAQPQLPVEKSDTVTKTRKSNALNVPEHIGAIDTNLQPGDKNQLPTSAVDADTRSNAACAGSDHLSIPNSSLVFREEVVAPPKFPSRMPSSEWPLIQPLADESSDGLLDRYQPRSSHRISSQAMSEMNEVAGFEPLVSFGHDEPEPKVEPIPPWVRVLLNLDDTQLIQSTFAYFEKKAEGPFLHQLSTMVAKENIPAASRLSGEEILSSPNYQEAAESLVGGHLCQSATFSTMPDMVTIHYTTEKARKVLKKSVAHRDGQKMNKYAAASQCAPPLSRPENGLSLSQCRFDLANIEALEQPKSTNTVDNPQANGPRVTYSPTQLLGLQQNASQFRIELLSREVVDYVVRQSATIKSVNPANILSTQQLSLRPVPNPRNIIGTTKSGLPIVAGRGGSQRHSGRGTFSSPAFSPTTSVAVWQADSVAETGDSRESVHGATLMNEYPTSHPVPAPPQKPIVPYTPSSNDSRASGPTKTEPVVFIPKPANTIESQETDKPLWGIALTTVRGQNQGRVGAQSNSKSPVSPFFLGGSGHVPTNSECDKLAKTFEELHLSKVLKEETVALQSQSVMASGAQTAALQPPSKEHAQPADIQLPAIPAPSSTKSFQPEPPVKVESPEVKPAPARLPTPGKADLAPSMTGIEPSNANKKESGVTQVSTEIKSQLTSQPTAPTLKSENEKTVNVVTPTPQFPEMAPLFWENVTNKDLKGVPGLKASKWASEPATQSPTPGARPPPMPTFNPTPLVPLGPIHPQYAYAPPQTFGNGFAYPPPAHPMMAAPSLQTIVIPDPSRPGYSLEVTGFAKDQVAQPFPPPMPTQPMMSLRTKQENVPHFQRTPPVNYESRPDMYHGHKSNKSSGSDFNFNSSSTPFTPSRDRGASAISPQHRTALSPIRQNDDVQTKLQSRLNSSLAGRSPNAHE